MLGKSNMKKSFIQFWPEMSWMSYDANCGGGVRVYIAPLVVYNPDRLNNINDPIPPSASVRVFYGDENWEAVNVYRS